MTLSGQALWTTSSPVRSTAADRSALVARSSPTSRWIWLSAAGTPGLHHVEKAVGKSDHVRAAIGRPGHGLEGFRSSHQDALAAQALVIRLGSDRRVTAYADVELIDTLTKDRATARRFVTKTLGPLAEADEELRETLLTYVQCGFNTTRAAPQAPTRTETPWSGASLAPTTTPRSKWRTTPPASPQPSSS